MSDDKLLKDIVDSLIEERKSDKKFKFFHLFWTDSKILDIFNKSNGQISGQ